MLFALGIGLLFSSGVPAAEPPVIQPGLWEITVQTRSPILGPPITHTVCIAKARATPPAAPKSKPSDDCQVLADAAAANETAYTTRCAKRNVTSTLRFTYLGDHFDGTATIKTADAEIQQVYTAKRIGDCDEVADAPVTSTAQ